MDTRMEIATVVVALIAFIGVLFATVYFCGRAIIKSVEQGAFSAEEGEQLLGTLSHSVGQPQPPRKDKK